MNNPQPVHPSNPLIETSMNTLAQRESSVGMTLKRRASSSFEVLGDASSRKRIKEGQDLTTESMEKTDVSPAVNHSYLAEELAKELQCGCCSEIVYKPVVVAPCQHFFCGSCCVLWIRNGGTNCPACRSVSTVVTPFRALQGIVDTLLRAAPHLSRTERERQQADEIYKAGHSMRIPPPREASPEPNIYQTPDLARPCPHCIPGNLYGWRCPEPIPDPNTDFEHAWHLEDGMPPGHAHCGNCENLLAIHAPSTSKCDLCQVYFCGIGVPNRCLAAPLLLQTPHGLADIGDLIQSADVYECFDSNTVEVEIMLDYLTAQRLTPRYIYREIIAHIQSQPRGFALLMELDLFTDVHSVAAGIDSNPGAPRNNICRLCATEVFLWGLREWWVQERQKGFLEDAVVNRKDCPDGSACTRQRDLVHSRELNHIFSSPNLGLQIDPQPQELLTQTDVPFPGTLSLLQAPITPAVVMLDNVPENTSESTRNIEEIPDIRERFRVIT